MPISGVSLFLLVKSSTSELPTLFPQTWIAQILHENGGDANDDEEELNLSGDVLLDGRVLCRVANAIAPGTVEVIHQDKSKNVRRDRVQRILSMQRTMWWRTFVSMFNCNVFRHSVRGAES